jgi:ribosomal protein S21
LDEALRILKGDVLPAFKRIGDVREHTVTLGQIANILAARGEVDEALRILRGEVLQSFKRLGTMRERAVTLGKIANILTARGEMDEALRILKEEVLPVYNILGDVRELLVGKTNVAYLMAQRGRQEDRPEVFELLMWSHRQATRLGLPEARQIEGFLRQNGVPQDVIDAHEARL